MAMRGVNGIKVFALAVFCLNLAASAAAPNMRAVYVGAIPFSSGNFNSTNSESALGLYRKMGYNVIFEQIVPPLKGEWDRTSSGNWTIKNPAARAALVNRIRSQNARVRALGMEYCPLYSPWGWDDNATIDISEGRAREAVYRSVDSVGGYGEDYYPTLIKTPQKWDDTGKVAWSGKAERATIAVGMPGNSNTAALLMLRNRAPGKTHLTTGQGYKLEADIAIPAAHPLKAGDCLRVGYSQRFIPGRKPDPLAEPLGSFFSRSPNNWCQLNSANFKIAGVRSGGVYDILNTDADTLYCRACASFRVSLDVWVESELPLGNGHGFSDSILWEFDLSASLEPRSSQSQIEVSDFKATRIDPARLLAYPDWERNFSGRFASDSLMRTKAIYRSESGLTRTIDLFRDKRPTPSGSWRLAAIQGHFLPYNEGLGWPYKRRTLDPLSPPYDLIATEMLRVIKEGLGGKEPKYFHLSGDEVFVFRRDNASRKGGPNPVYNSVSNGEFYARVIEKDIERYAKVFGIPPGAFPTAKFVVWGDPVLPFGTGYQLYADGHGDNSALGYWRRRSLQRLIQPNIWIYEETEVPGSNPHRLLLDEPGEVQKSVTSLLDSGFRYSIAYSTDATLEDIRSVKPGIGDDGKHIQHEIDLARNWCDLVGTARNNPAFEGFIYTGWNGDLRTNNWDGLYPIAYFGWVEPSSRDLPAAWKKRAGPSSGQPRLDMLMRNIWAPADSLSAAGR